jgi:hypothetical protein
MQGARVQGAPFIVGAVGALDAVPDRHVHMQLRVPVTGQVVQEQAGDQTAAVAPLPRLGRMVPGPGVGSVPLQPVHRFPRRFHQRVLQLVRPGVERVGLSVVAAVAGLPGGGPVGDVQHRDTLDRTDGQVEIRHLIPVPATLSRTDRGQLGRAGVGMLGQEGGHRRLFPVASGLGLTPLDQLLSARAGVVLIQGADDVRVNLPVESERHGALARPLAGWSAGRRVVRHRPGTAAAMLAAGEVGDVMARVQRHIGGQDP